MTVSLEEWDRAVAPILQDIEMDAIWARHYLEKIANALDRMPVKPDFVTRADAEIAQTKKALYSTLRALEKAQERFLMAERDGVSDVEA